MSGLLATCDPRASVRPHHEQRVYSRRGVAAPVPDHGSNQLRVEWLVAPAKATRFRSHLCYRVTASRTAIRVCAPVHETDSITAAISLVLCELQCVLIIM